MSYERDDYMRRQEADHGLIRMRTQPVAMKRPTNWNALSADQILAGLSVEQLREGERRALSGIALIEAERLIEPVHEAATMRTTHGGWFDGAMEDDLDHRQALYSSALRDVRAELQRRDPATVAFGREGV